MISGYNIKKSKKDEVLYLYLDIDNDFGIEDIKKNIKSLKQEIKEYIKNNNIDFKGTTIKIMVGGLMIGTIALNNINKINVSNDINHLTNIMPKYTYKIDNEVKEDSSTNEFVEQKEVISDANIDHKEVNKINKETKEEKNISKSNNIQSNTKEILKNTTVVSDTKQATENKEVESTPYVKKEGKIISLYKSNGNIINIDLEEYLIGVVGSEMPASFNIEALKAQAIVARTYTLKLIETGRHITDNNSTQNYKTESELRSMWDSSFNTYYEKIKSAVDSTKGIVIMYNNKLIDAVYHSTSNGYTESAINVWGNDTPYLKSVSSIGDSTNKSYVVTTFFTYQDISNKLSNDINIDSNVEIIDKTSSGRVKTLKINNKTYNGVDFRTLLNLRSTDITIEKLESGVSITTTGYGHGVGMSQYGANAMANSGSKYDEILKHYYTGVSLDIIK